MSLPINDFKSSSSSNSVDLLNALGSAQITFSLMLNSTSVRTINNMMLSSVVVSRFLRYLQSLSLQSMLLKPSQRNS